MQGRGHGPAIILPPRGQEALQHGQTLRPPTRLPPRRIRAKAQRRRTGQGLRGNPVKHPRRSRHRKGLRHEPIP